MIAPWAHRHRRWCEDRVFRLRHGRAGDLGLIGVELVVGLLLLWSSRSKWLDRRLTQLIWQLLHRFSRLSKRDVETPVELADHQCRL
jgi:hypothetical protein